MQNVMVLIEGWGGGGWWLLGANKMGKEKEKKLHHNGVKCIFMGYKLFAAIAVFFGVFFVCLSFCLFFLSACLILPCCLVSSPSLSSLLCPVLSSYGHCSCCFCDTNCNLRLQEPSWPSPRWAGAAAWDVSPGWRTQGHCPPRQAQQKGQFWRIFRTTILRISYGQCPFLLCEMPARQDLKKVDFHRWFRRF